MTEKKFEFNIIENGNIKLKNNFKKRGAKSADILFNKELLDNLCLSLEFISASPSVKPKFADKLENFLKPRFEEIQRMVYLKEIDENKFYIEFLKENGDELLQGLTIGSVLQHLEEKDVDYAELKNLLKNAKYTKN